MILPDESVVYKVFLVDLGLWALSNGQWRLVEAITELVMELGHV
jgi:hypothetical protein